MSVTLPTSVIVVHAAALVILSALLVLALVLFLRLRRLRALDPKDTALASTGTEPDEDGSDEAGPDETGPEEAMAEEAESDDAVADSAGAIEDAVAAGVRRGLQEALPELRAEFRIWIEEAVADAADAHLGRRWDELKASVAEAPGNAGAVGTDLPAAEPSVAVPPAVESPTPPAPMPPTLADADRIETPEWERVRGLGGVNESPSGDARPADPHDDPRAAGQRGVQLNRPTTRNMLADAFECLAVLRLAPGEIDRLRSAVEGRAQPGAMRKLFAILHRISAERRLAADQPNLNWQRVDPFSLERFVGKFHPGVETKLLWPSVGERFDPRTMHILQKDDSGRGVVTEVVAPGYATEADNDPVKALIIY